MVILVDPRAPADLLEVQRVVEAAVTAAGGMLDYLLRELAVLGKEADGAIYAAEDAQEALADLADDVARLIRDSR